MPFLLALKLFAGGALKKLLAWLGSLTLWQIVSLGLAIFVGIQFLELRGERRHSAKLQAQVVNYSRQLQAISSKKNEQIVVTRDRIKIVEKQVRHADDVAKNRATPVPHNCKTKPEILGADL